MDMMKNKATIIAVYDLFLLLPIKLIPSLTFFISIKNYLPILSPPRKFKLRSRLVQGKY